MSFSTLQILFSFFFIPFGLWAQDLFVYELQSAYINKAHKTTTGFISLSDNYQFPEHPDSLVFPRSVSEKGLEYAVLESKYRSMLLQKLSISETDKVFAYDFENDSTYTFSVNDLNAVVILNPYDMPGNSYPQYYYMIGFEINPKAIKTSKNYLERILVSIGDTNPFSQANLHPIKWTPIDSSYFPSNFTQPERLQRRSYSLGKTYEYIDGNLGHYSQDIMTSNTEIWMRHVVIVDICTDEVLLNHFYSYSEGTSLTPLNKVHIHDTERTFQWTGTLFDNQAPIVFGFTSQSFGCIRLFLLEQSSRYINLFCDNRH